MIGFPINYDEPLFRPPSEGKSLIVQVTLGCSWNKCSFCEMYTSKRFTVRKQEDVFADIEAMAPYASHITKVFLADGDPLVLSNSRLIPILTKITQTFPNLKRISTYATPANIFKKTQGELLELKEAGLTLLYVGIESGDDETLKMIQKGESKESVIAGILKGHEAGIETSVMVINGVGGKAFSDQHAIASAEVLNATQPKFASTLVLTTYKGIEHFKNRIIGDFAVLDLFEQMKELKLFMEHLNLENTIFRSDHASNQLVLKGTLGKDKEKFLKQIENAIEDPTGRLRPKYNGY